MISCFAMFPSLFKAFFILFFITCQYTTYGLSSSLTASPASYSDHCASIVPESRPTVRYRNIYVVPFVGGYYTGGARILGDHFQNYLLFRPTRSLYKTVAKGVYKIEANLIFRSLLYSFYGGNGTDSRFGSHYHGTVDRSAAIKFSLKGYFSEVSRKLCMVGSASWQSKEGKSLNLDAVLKLKYANESSNIFTSLVTGTLESINSANDLGHFEPISIYDFPYLSNYNYSLVSKESGGCGNDPGVTKDQSVSLESRDFCSVFYRGTVSFELEYVAECNKSQNCNGFGGDKGYLPKFMLLNVIQCSDSEEKLRYKIEFGNSSYPRYRRFDLNSTLIGEGSWDAKTNRLCVVACRILNQAAQDGSDVGDCTTRLTLRYPSIWTIRNNSKIAGEIWTNKTVNDPGYFRKIMFKSWRDNVAGLPGLKYEYTELDRVRKSCPLENTAKSEGMQYPDGHSYDMRFDMSVKHSKTRVAWGNAIPLFVGNELYEKNSSVVIDSMNSDSGDGAIPEDDEKTGTPVNISYKLSLSPFWNVQSGNLFTSHNLTRNHLGEVEISAEGLYDPKTGHLCMIGCRVLNPSIQESRNNRDCEILVNFDFPSMNSSRMGEHIKGSIKSTRKEDDPLYFEELSTSSAAYYANTVKQSIWRMDIEIIMALVSNSLACIFVGWQLFHVKRNPQILSYISLFMILILCLGSMIPLVLNFEALFLRNHNKESLLYNTGGWLEANEVTVRIVTMVAFLLQIRLLQLVWAARTSDENDKGTWVGEKKAAFLSLPTYILGGLLTLLIHWIGTRYGYQPDHPHTLWGDLRSYAGLILDSFLFPQILFNVFCSSRESSLSHTFYIGMTLVRVLPHGYDLYRNHNHAREFFNGSYYYANPSADFYSTAWDVIISIVGIVFAVIIFLQQRLGGRWILPQRFRELELYQKVPVVNNE